MVFFSCIPMKPYRFLRKRCRSSSIKSSTKDSCKLCAKDPSEFSSPSGDIHNQNLSQNPATSTEDCCKLSAKDSSELSSRRGDIHNQNLSQSPATYEAVQELPFDIITEILSWLPVESLLRFKCVCKNWRSLLGDYKFIVKHMARGRSHQLSCQRIVEPSAGPGKQVTTILYAENFRCVLSGAGLFMEESLTTGVFRIRNFATGQVLYLPDAHDSTGGVHVGFAFDSSNGECKVACVCNNKDGHGEFGDKVGFKVLSIGKDVEWRTLKLPSQNESRVMISRRIARALPNQGVAHLVDLIEVGKDFQLEVLSFDLWSECFTVTTLPQGVFKDLHRVSILRWKDYIAVADIVGEALNVLVLQDFKEHKWSNITVPLEFLKHDPVLKDQIKPILATRFGKLQFTNPVRNDILEYDMEREKITATGTKSTEQKIFLVKPSLVTLKGMKRE